MNDRGGGHRVSPPRATYRIELSRELPLRAAADLVYYLDALGISHVYSSPLLRGRRGSTHRYDVVDPSMIDPAIGTDQDLRQLAGTLHGRGMGLILDIVPNHMAATGENAAWESVLAHGPASPFAHWFDIDWDYPHSSGPARLILPILGESRSSVSERHQPALCYREGRFRVGCVQHVFPIDPATVPWIFAMGTMDEGEDFDPQLGDVKEFTATLRTLRELPPRTTPDPALRLARRCESEEALNGLAALYERSTAIRRRVDRAVAAFAGTRGPGRLQRLLDKQVYRLVDWRRAGREVNYRRFFSASDLVAVRVEDPAVFEATHVRILAWVAEGLIDGLRIDNLDGLLDPLSYLERLRSVLVEARGRRSVDLPVPVYVEKILARSESLPEHWPVEGTTGYDFLNDIEAIFIAPEGIAAIDTWHRRMTAPWRRESDFATRVAEAKRRFLEGELAADVERLTRLIAGISRDDRRATNLSERELRTTVIEVAACLPVHRTYIDDRQVPVERADRAAIEKAISAVRRRRRARPAALDLLRRVLLLEEAVGLSELEARDRRALVQRFQQLTGPAMAMGLENAAFRFWIPLVSLNNVGGRPDRPLGGAVMAFHLANRERLSRWPGAMICTTTHDTKHSGDVCARLDVLSEIPEIWTAQVKRWHRLNRHRRRRVGGKLVPDRNTEYLLYQALVGIWPLPERGKPPGALPETEALEGLRDRLRAYMRRAAREAKVRTNSTDPSPDYEAALDDFVSALINVGTRGESSEFLPHAARLAARVSRPGLWNALAKTLVHLTAPGVPDIYQGDELWNFSLVDPDDRRPVDFEHRRGLLRTLEDSREQNGLPPRLIRELVEWPEDGRIKLWVISRTLGLRRNDPTMFSLGDYAPVRVEGTRAGHILTFTRRQEDRTALVVVPRLLTGLIHSPDRAPLGAEVWRDTSLRLPARLFGSPFRNVLTNSIHVSKGTRGTGFLRVAELLETFPVALLVAG